ncbi:GumC family protein [Crateriforma conspicua]|nr:polysaccharide biosynthesis tyrosine autokinase [Crateriforma conspicua]
MSVLMSIPLAAVFGTAAFLSQSPKYTSSALLQLSSTDNSLVFDGDGEDSEFELFQGTQRELVKSRLVMTAALRDPTLSDSRVVREEEFPVEWMLENIKVDTPKQTEIMTISTSEIDPEEAIELVNSVVDAFLVQVVNRERSTRQARLDSIERVFDEKDAELRRKRRDLKSLAERLGTSDSEVLSIAQQFLMQELGDVRSQLISIQLRKWTAQATLRSLDAMDLQTEHTTEKDEEVPLDEVQAALLNDPIYVELMRDRLNAFRLQSEADSAMKETGKTSTFHELRGFVDSELESRKQQIQDELKELAPLRRSQQEFRTRQERERERSRIAAEVEVLDQLENQLQTQADTLKKEFGSIGNQSVDIEMMRREISQLDEVLGVIAQQREQLRVELRSRPRVEVLQRAEEAEPSGSMKRVALAGMGSLAGLIIPLGLCIGFDLLQNRVNSAASLGQKTGIRLLSSIPLVPIRSIGGKNRRSKRSLFWQHRLSESMKRLASRINNSLPSNRGQMLIVTSANRNEGRTTVSTQLATALAKSGRNVLLVDADFRKPAIHRVYGVPQSPGLSEVFRGEVEAHTVVHKTEQDRLQALTVGAPCETTLQILAQDKLSSHLKEIRTLADIVVVDGGPVLSAADMECVSPHVDGVVIVARRDVSRVGDIQVAIDHLRMAETHVCGAVVVEPLKSDAKPGKHADLGTSPGRRHVDTSRREAPA